MDVPDVFIVLRKVDSLNGEEPGVVVIREFVDDADRLDIGEAAVEIVANGFSSVDCDLDLWLSVVGTEHIVRDWLVEDVVIERMGGVREETKVITTERLKVSSSDLCLTDVSLTVVAQPKGTPVLVVRILRVFPDLDLVAKSMARHHEPVVEVPSADVIVKLP